MGDAVGSLFAIGVGRFIDRLGARLVLTAVAALLGVVVCAMSGGRSFWPLAIAVTLTRGLGQSALSVISLTMVGQWFVRRIDIAMAIYSIVMSIGFMIAFPLVGSLVQSQGWRSAWFAIGVALLVALAPLSWFLVRRRPSTGSTRATDDRRHPTHLDRTLRSTWQEALSTPAFWIFSIGAALYGLVASGIGLFNESILAERGFGADVYYQTLIVTAITALDRQLRRRLARHADAAADPARDLAVRAGAGLAALPHVTTIVQVMAWATAMGLGGGLVMVLFFSVWPRVYGRAHLGRIQGAAQAMTVVASAIGPLLLAWCIEWTGSYAGMFNILARVIGAVAFVVDASRRCLAGAVEDHSQSSLAPVCTRLHPPYLTSKWRRV